MNDFLPEDYKEPVTSRYMQFEEGENRFRVLPAKPDKTTLIMGWEYWVTVNGARKPFRVTKDTRIPTSELEINPKTGDIDEPKFFWAMAVWNYKAKAVQILEIKQKTIRQVLESLSRNSKWGSPVNYDLVVNQTIESSKTSYSVTPDPKEPIDKDILDVYKAIPINLDALYGKPGTDPFSSNERLSVDDVKDIEDVLTDHKQMVVADELVSESLAI